MQEESMKYFLTISTILIFLTPISVFGQKNKYEKRQEKLTKAIFDNCEEGKHKAYSGSIKVEQTNDYVYYETDSIRIYLSYHFFIGFLSNSDTTSRQIFDDFKENYCPLFERGFLTGKMFACELNDSCKFPSDIPMFTSKGDTLEPYIPKLFGYEGSTIKILNIKQKTDLNQKKTRKFEIWAVTSKIETGWGSFPVFYLELTNNKANKNTNLKEFINGARLTCFQYVYTQI